MIELVLKYELALRTGDVTGDANRKFNWQEYFSLRVTAVFYMKI